MCMFMLLTITLLELLMTLLELFQRTDGVHENYRRLNISLLQKVYMMRWLDFLMQGDGPGRKWPR